MERCDRCGIADKTVVMTDFCLVCGAVLLCPACEALHRRELAEAVDWA